MRAKKIDKNQPQIVKDLRKAGYSVELDKDDVLVGKTGVTQWIEIKEKSPFGINKKLIKGFIKDSQYKLLWNWNGQYNICWQVEQIINLFKEDACLYHTSNYGLYPWWFQMYYMDYLTPKELNRLRQEGIIQDGVKPRSLLNA